MTTGQLARLCRRVATSINAGLDDLVIWEKEVRRAKHSQRTQWLQMERSLNQGNSVAESMEEADQLFPPLVCELVNVGERAGRQGDVFTNLANHYDNLIKMRRTFLAGIIWPALELAASICIVGGLILILGWISQMNQGAKPIDFFGLGLGTTGNFVLYCFGVLAMLSMIGIPTLGIFKGWFGSKPMEVALKIPVVGQCVQTLALSRMAWSLGMAVDSGMDAIQSLGLSLRSTQNAYYIQHQSQVQEAIREGHPIHVALEQTSAFPSDFLMTLENGEISGQLTESMDRLSNEYRKKSEVMMQLLAVVGGFVAMGMVAAVIIVAIFYMFFSFVMPAYQIPESF